MKIHIPEQTFEIDETGYGRIKFELCKQECYIGELNGEIVKVSENSVEVLDKPLEITEPGTEIVPEVTA